eukprot:11354580-Alexandrium_andersonii.AAC.1
MDTSPAVKLTPRPSAISEHPQESSRSANAAGPSSARTALAKQARARGAVEPGSAAKKSST